MSIQEMTQDLAKEFGAASTAGALVGDIVEDGPAAKAKLQRGDILTAYNGTPVRDPGHLRALVAETAPGTNVTVSVFRDKRAQDLRVTIGEVPTELTTAGRGPGGRKGEHILAGVTVENASKQSDRFGRSKIRSGVIVTAIEADSAAERAGLRLGDVIREINRKPVKDVQDFERLTAQLKPKASVLLLLHRKNATIFLSISPGG